MAEQHAGCQHNWSRQKRASCTHAYELWVSLCDRKGVTSLSRASEGLSKWGGLRLAKNLSAQQSGFFKLFTKL